MALSAEQKQKLLDKMRKNQSKLDSKSRDATEWRPPKVEKEEEKTFKIIILPPVQSGDKITGGTADKTMDLWCWPHGHHFVNNKRYECPRVGIDQGQCPMCSLGFDLMRETDDKAVRGALAKEWLSRQMYAANIYFLKHKDNPEDLQGKVFWWSMPDAVYQLCKRVLSSNDAGDQEEPKAHGLFFLPEECYTLNVIINHKSGYNNYEKSLFAGKARSLAATDEEISAILAQRHDIISKFDAPDISALEKLVNEKTNASATSTTSTASSKSEAGSEDPPPRVKTESKQEAKPAETKPTKTESKQEAKPAVNDDDGPPPRQKTAKAETAKAEPAGSESSDASDPDIDSLLAKL